jgi:hypothetical protein
MFKKKASCGLLSQTHPSATSLLTTKRISTAPSSRRCHEFTEKTVLFEEMLKVIVAISRQLARFAHYQLREVTGPSYNSELHFRTNE